MEARHSNRFRVSVNTGARSLVRFYLLYEELLARHRGVYQYLVHITPHQRLGHFSLAVSITEQRNITHIAVPPLRRQKEGPGAGGSLEGAEIIMSPTHPGKVTVNYNPDIHTLQRQLKLGKHPLQVL